METEPVVMASESKDGNSTVLMTEAKQDLIEWMKSLVAEPGNWRNKISRIFDTNSSETNSTEPSDKVMEYLDSRLPLLNNNRLDLVAQVICDKAFVNGLGSNATNIDGLLSSAGYFSKQAEVVTSAIVMQDYLTPKDGASILFANLLKSMYNSHSLLFNDEYVEFGVGFCKDVVSIEKSTKANVYLLTMVFARPAGPQPQWIQCGHIYFDKNNNNDFDPGEGLENVMIESYRNGYMSVSLYDGKYCFIRPRGEWLLYLEGVPHYQDLNTYRKYLEETESDGILITDYQVMLTQQDINAINSGQMTLPKRKCLWGCL